MAFFLHLFVPLLIVKQNKIPPRLICILSASSPMLQPQQKVFVVMVTFSNCFHTFGNLISETQGPGRNSFMPEMRAGSVDKVTLFFPYFL